MREPGGHEGRLTVDVAPADGSFTCPMHPEVRADGPGTCPECGMALEPRTARPADAAESHGRPSRGEAGGHDREGHIDWPLHRRLRTRSALWGAAAGLLLVGVYVGTLGLANSVDHVADEFLRLWGWMVPLIAGFSLQVGLFAYARGATRVGHGAPHAHGVVASGGASTVSMIACCAHHLTDVLPLIGLAGAVTVLAAYQDVFLLFGVLSNALGLLYVLGLLRRHRLFPNRASVLSAALRWPVEKAFLPAIAVAAVVFLFVLWRGST